MNQARSATATFSPPNQTLTVAAAGSGSGSITASGINCPGDCTQSYAFNTLVTLSQSPSGGSTFAGWSGDCTGTGSCQVTMSAARNVTATFDPAPPQALSVAVAGTGSVTATGIACPGDCAESYAFGAVVTLTAAPAAGSALTGWSGACTGTALTCQVTMSQARSVTATFAQSNALFKDGFEAGNACAWSLRAGAPCP
jgi:hypothetical protein